MHLSDIINRKKKNSEEKISMVKLFFSHVESEMLGDNQVEMFKRTLKK